MKITKSIYLAIIFLLSLVFISCNTLPKDIDEEVGPEDMIIKAQQYSDAGKTNAAEIMYNRLLDQYGSDTNYRVIAEFEIAHIKLKAHKYAEAKPLYEDIINIYDSTYETLPGKYLVLAKNDLARLNDEYKYNGDKKRAQVQSARKTNP